MMIFKINETSPLPIYQQVKQSILLEFMANRFEDGDQMPSIRALAKTLKINPNTVAKVYYNLQQEGHLEGKKGSGFIVKIQKHKIDKLKTAIIEAELKTLLQKAFSLGFSKQDMSDLLRRLLNNG